MNTTKNKYPTAYETTSVIDFQNVISTIRTRLVPILATMGIILLVTAVAYLWTKPRYSAEARVGITRQADEVVAVPNPQGRNQSLVTDSSSVDTEVAQISSPGTLGRVVDALNLSASTAFLGDNAGKATAREIALAKLENGLSINRDGDSYAISISYSSTDPKLAAAIVNSTVDAYLTRQQDEARAKRDGNVKLLASRLETLKGDVEKADGDVARFRAATNLVDIQNDATSAQQSIAVLNSQLASAQAEQAAAEARNSSASANSAGAGTTVASPVLQQLRTEEARLSAEQAALAERYGPQHPALEQVNRQLQEVRRQTGTEIARVRQGLAADAQVARQRTSSIVSSMGAQQGQLLQGNAASVRLAELEREATAAKSLYEALLDRYRQTVAQQGTEQSNAYVIARATQPLAPDSPRLLTYAAGGIITALLAASIVTIGLQLTESGLMNRRQVERSLNLPVLASVPDLRTLPKDRLTNPTPYRSSAQLVEKPGSLYSESFRAIRTALKIGQEGQLARSIAITSALPDEGKTTTAFSLARSVALSGLRVLLIDCDLRRQASSRQMETPITHGLLEVLSKEATLEQALTRDSASGAFLLPQRTDDGARNFDAIASSEMQQLVRSLEEQFDLVILDTAPILAIADSRAVASMADATVVAIRWRKTPTQAVQIALDQLALSEANVAGIVLTMVDLKWQTRAGGGDELKYYGRYAKYYS